MNQVSMGTVVLPRPGTPSASLQGSCFMCLDWCGGARLSVRCNCTHVRSSTINLEIFELKNLRKEFFHFH